MNKWLSTFFAVIILFTLTGCTSQVKSAGKPSATNQRVARNVVKKLGHSEVTAKVETDVVDNQSKKDKRGDQLPHQQIQVIFKNRATIKKVEAARTNLQNDSATKSEKRLIRNYQRVISEAALQLKGHDVLLLGYAVKTSNSIAVIAESRNGKDVVPEVVV
ncbi:hypothetical protein [Levilactobacillus tongjiangensis]|uniref:Lipoprotein n=1 Tax=Levilactobacillus tongjiangensis TaxID=2486023 RepID=A0ABW1SNF3_9LACO|nr:hypothetical protein [Levilactobacillus tongjiangensis]